MGEQKSALALIERKYSSYQFLVVNIVHMLLWPALKPAVVQLDPEHIHTAYSIGLQFEIFGDPILKPVELFSGSPSFSAAFS